MMTEFKVLGKALSYFAAIIILSTAIFTPVMVRAEESPPEHSADPSPATAEQSHHVAPSASSNIDAVLVLDASGSMRLTDPARLRDEGAKLFLDSLKPSDRVAIVEFAADAKQIVGLTENNQKEFIAGNIDRVSDSGEYTDLLAGLKLAREILQREGSSNNKKVVVLLSDGKMDPKPEIASPDAQLAKLFSSELPLFRNQNIKVHTVAFSDYADKELLLNIAMVTGGEAKFSADADGIKEAFGGVSRTVATNNNTVKEINPAVKDIPVSIAGTVSKTFTIAQAIEEATFYINRGASSGITIHSPSGAAYSSNSFPPNALWHSGPDFDVVTFTNPESGNWNVVGLESKDNFATVLTNLKLMVESELEEVSVDDAVPVEAKFYESRKPINLPQLSSILKYSYQVIPTDRISAPIQQGVLHDDGDDGDSMKEDGVYSGNVHVDIPGSYRLYVNVRGPTLVREHSINFTVTPRMINLSLLESEDAAHGDTGHDKKESDADNSTHHHKVDTVDRGEKYFRIELDPSVQAVKSRVLKLRAVSSTGTSYTIPVPKAHGEESEYLLPTSALSVAGTFDITAILSGNIKGKPFSAKSNSVSYHSVAKAPEVTLEKEDPHVSSDTSTIESEAKSEEEKPVRSSGGSGAWAGIILLTLANIAAAIMAVGMLKKFLGTIVVAEEVYVPPQAAITTITQLRERMGAASLDLNSPSFSSKALDEILAKASLSENDLKGLEEAAIVGAFPVTEGSIAEAPSSTAAESTIIIDTSNLPIEPPSTPAVVATATAPVEAPAASPASSPAAETTPQPPPPPAETPVESEIDEETRKLLAEISESIGAPKA